jgi:hypothetical protein
MRPAKKKAAPQTRTASPKPRTASKAQGAKKKGAGALARPEAASAGTLATAKLLAADILLYRGTSWLSKAIRFFDGTDVSHASLFLAGTPQSVAEAIGKGLIAQPLTKSVDGSEWVVARRLKSRPTDMSLVLGRAEHYLDEGERYAYEQILLIAFVCLIRKPKITPVFKQLLTKVLEEASSLLLKLTALGKQPMICSEFVYRCYDEALPDALDLFTLSLRREVTPEIARQPAARVKVDRVHPESVLATVIQRQTRRPRSTPRAEAAEPATLNQLIQRYLGQVKEPSVEAAITTGVADSDVTAAVVRFAAAWWTAREPRHATLETADPNVTLTQLYSTAADFVTPGDLLKSESLMTMGRLNLR